MEDLASRALLEGMMKSYSDMKKNKPSTFTDTLPKIINGMAAISN